MNWSNGQILIFLRRGLKNMKRITIKPRNNWQKEVEKLGFGFHTTNVPYWDESVYYEMEMSEILFIEKATAELWDLCLGAVQHVMDHNLYNKFGIPNGSFRR
jgi:glutathionylspermidine synthase